MFHVHKRVMGLGIGLLLMAILTLGSAATAFADGPVVATADLGAGSLGATASAVDTAGFVLSGANQTYIYSLPVAVADATGSKLGWNLTITSSVFTSGANTLAADASSITAVTITAGAGIAPTAVALTYPLAINATAVKFFSATAATGVGSSTITPTIHVAVPGGTLPGSYTSTVTVASVSAP
jgi:hypothetical protein